MTCCWCNAPATRQDDHGHYVCTQHGVFANDRRVRVLSRPLYRCTAKYWELVPSPARISRSRIADFLWNLMIHRSCSCTMYLSAGSEAEALTMLHDYVTAYKPGPQARLRCRLG